MGILIALLVLIFLIILFLSIPFNLLFYLHIQEDFVFQMKLRWFFGLAHFNIAPGKKEPDTKIKKKKQQKPISFDLILKVIGTKGLPRQFIRLIKDVFHSIRIKRLSFDLKIGLEDPTDNAYIYACAVPVSYLLRRTPYRINIQPVFENELVFDCLADCNLKVFPITLVGCFLKNFLSAPLLKASWMLIKDRWTVKK